jgi:uncharacterized cupredoxin-like copper-binding protein
VRSRTIGAGLVVVGLMGLIGTAWGFSARSGGVGAGFPGWDPSGTAAGASCSPSALPGQTVDVVLSDMGGMMSSGMMGGHGMFTVTVDLSVVDAGDVSFRVWNRGTMTHEFLVLPLPLDGAGTRPVETDDRVSESGSLGEASESCGEGTGEGVAPGTVGWVTMHLNPGKYELLCNLPGHYASGMFTEFDVR